MATADTNSPAWRDPSLQEFADQRTRCRDTLGGTDVLRTPTYLPKLPRENPTSYTIRRKMGEVTNLLKAAVRAGEGLMTAKPPTIQEGVSPRFTTLCADIDGRGTALAVWLRGVVRRLLGDDGWCLALASTPIRAGAEPNRAQERDLRLQPYVSVYRADDVMSYRTLRVGGRDVLSQLVLREAVTEPDGTFGIKIVEQYRVLQRVSKGHHVSQVYRIDDKGEAVPSGDAQTITTDELPVVEFSVAPEEGFGKAAPPLVDLADLTISHFTITNDRRWSLKGGCFPWLVRIGFEEKVEGAATSAGVNEALDLPMGGDAKWIAPPMEATQPTRDELTDIERRAAALSMSFLSGESANEQKTATAASIDQQGQDASLASVGISVHDSLNRLGALLSEMLGEDVRDTYFDMTTKFRGIKRDPAYMRVILDAWKEAGVPLDALLYVLVHGELPEDVDLDQMALDAMAEAEAERAAAIELAQQTGAGGADNRGAAGDSQRKAA